MKTETSTFTLSDGSKLTIETAEAVCAKCGEKIIRIAGSDWGHGDELVSRPRRSYLGGRYDHKAVVR